MLIGTDIVEIVEPVGSIVTAAAAVVNVSCPLELKPKYEPDEWYNLSP